MAYPRSWAFVLAAAVSVSPPLNPAWAQRPGAMQSGIDQLNAGRLDAAAEVFSEASTAPPLEGWGFFNLGVVRARQSRPADAASAFARAADLLGDAADRAQAHYNRGVVLVQMGQLQEGMAEFAHALRLTPSDEAARTNFSITRARLATERARTTPPLTRTRPDDVRQALERVPDQSYAFNRGKRATRRGALDKDW